MEVTQERQGYEGSLSDLIVTVRDTILRRWKVMAAIAAVIFLLGVAMVMMMTPQYEAVSRVQIDPSRDPLAKAGGQQNSTLSPAHSAPSAIACISGIAPKAGTAEIA